MSNSDSKIIPRPSVFKVPKYISGKSASYRSDNPIKLSANENPYGPSKNAMEVFCSRKIILGFILIVIMKLCALPLRM